MPKKYFDVHTTQYFSVQLFSLFMDGCWLSSCFTSRNSYGPSVHPSNVSFPNTVPVSYKRFFRCNNCFLLLVYTIHLSQYTFGTANDGNHLYETRVICNSLIDTASPIYFKIYDQSFVPYNS